MKSAAPGARILALASGLILALAGAPTAHADFAEGMQALGQKQYKEAASQFEKEVRRNKDLDQGWYYMGLSHLGAKNYPEAVKALKTATTLRPEKADYHMNLGKAYLGSKDYEGAAAAFGQAYAKGEKSTDKYEASYYQGQCLQAASHYAEAAAALRKAQAIKNDKKIAYQIGGNEFKAKNWARASEAFEGALKLDPKDPQILEGIINANIQLARGAKDPTSEKAAWAKVANYADKGADADPKNAQFAEFRANALYRAEKYAEAIPAYDAVLALKPKDCALMTEKGLSLYKLKDYAQAVPTLQGASECDPKNAVALTYIGYIFNDQALPIQKQGTEKEDVSLLQQSVDLRVQGLQYLERAYDIDKSEALKKSIATAKTNLQTNRENIETFLENQKNESDYQQKKAEYEAKTKQFQDYEAKRKAWDAKQKAGN